MRSVAILGVAERKLKDALLLALADHKGLFVLLGDGIVAILNGSVSAPAPLHGTLALPWALGPDAMNGSSKAQAQERRDRNVAARLAFKHFLVWGGVALSNCQLS